MDKKSDGTNKGAWDEPSDRDYEYEHLFGATEAIDPPAYVNLNEVLEHTHNQGKTWHCTAYAAIHAMEILNSIEWGEDILCDPEKQWKAQMNRRGNPAAMEWEGDSLQNSLGALQDNGAKDIDGKPRKEYTITGYAKIKDTVADMKNVLFCGSPIFSGRGNHCFVICGYDNVAEEWICLNSYGRTKAKPTGEFRVPYAETDSFFTKYILFDTKDLMKIFKDVTDLSPMAVEIKWARDNGIVQGYGDPATKVEDREFRPAQPIRRDEMVSLLYKFFTFINKK
jgi:hypothetical protein